MALSCTGAFWCTTLRNPGFILIYLLRERERERETPDCWAVRQLSLSHLNPKAESTGKRSFHSRFPGTQKWIILISEAPLTEGCAVRRHFSEVSSSRGHFSADWSSFILLWHTEQVWLSVELLPDEPKVSIRPKRQPTKHRNAHFMSLQTFLQ